MVTCASIRTGVDIATLVVAAVAANITLRASLCFYRD